MEIFTFKKSPKIIFKMLVLLQGSVRPGWLYLRGQCLMAYFRFITCKHWHNFLVWAKVMWYDLKRFVFQQKNIKSIARSVKIEKHKNVPKESYSSQEWVHIIRMSNGTRKILSKHGGILRDQCEYKK